MLKHFQVPEEDAVRVNHETLRATVEEIFRKVGLSEEDSVLGADVLVYADLRGVDTHGVSNMLRYYVAAYNDGRMNPRPLLDHIAAHDSTDTFAEVGQLPQGVTGRVGGHTRRYTPWPKRRA